MKKLTQIIAAWVLVNYNNNELYVVTTVDGNEVWVPKSKFDTNAETVTFEVKKAGDKYTKKDGTEGTLAKDRNEFIGCGRQIVKKQSIAELMKDLAASGCPLPALQMS